MTGHGDAQSQGLDAVDRLGGDGGVRRIERQTWASTTVCKRKGALYARLAMFMLPYSLVIGSTWQPILWSQLGLPWMSLAVAFIFFPMDEISLYQSGLRPVAAKAVWANPLDALSFMPSHKPAPPGAASHQTNRVERRKGRAA